MERIRKFILQRRTLFALMVFSLLAVLVALFVTCQPREKLPEAPPTHAPTLTATPTITATWTIHPTITQAASVTPTVTATHTLTLTPTLQPTDTSTPSPTLPTIPAGRNQLTPPPLPNAGASAADLVRMTRTHR